MLPSPLEPPTTASRAACHRHIPFFCPLARRVQAALAQPLWFSVRRFLHAPCNEPVVDRSSSWMEQLHSARVCRRIRPERRLDSAIHPDHARTRLFDSNVTVSHPRRSVPCGGVRRRLSSYARSSNK
ncbi:hypothetical protein OH77DRAFT_505686 [Trametes cingulata]|nr:hypothetical protein OH77DRAFT_505686 [Trametes cingulata]